MIVVPCVCGGRVVCDVSVLVLFDHGVVADEDAQADLVAGQVLLKGNFSLPNGKASYFPFLNTFLHEITVKK
jgi:hypothetical protein